MNISFLDVDVLSLDPRLGLAYGSDDAAAVDLPALLDSPLILMSGESKRISAKFQMHMRVPEGLHAAALILPRSGWGSRGLVIANTVGLIDSDYQGEVQLTLLNRGTDPLLIKPGDRIMQMLFIPVLRARFNPVESFTVETKRGAGGFGSTGD